MEQILTMVACLVVCLCLAQAAFKDKMERILTLVVCLVVCLCLAQVAFGEERTMYVIADLLNGRAWPTTKSRQEAFFEYGDQVTATGKWSEDKQWIEIKGGEGGTVWCKAQYLTERMNSFTASNEGRKSVRIRKSPVNGKVVGYLKGGRTLEITQVILGWGKCGKGWIDMEYLCEVEE